MANVATKGRAKPTMYEKIGLATHCYIGRNPCGCICSVVVDTADAATRKSVAEFMRDGRTIERMSLEELRANSPFGCKCPKPEGLFVAPPKGVRP